MFLLNRNHQVKEQKPLTTENDIHLTKAVIVGAAIFKLSSSQDETRHYLGGSPCLLNSFMLNNLLRETLITQHTAQKTLGLLCLECLRKSHFYHV